MYSVIGLRILELPHYYMQKIGIYLVETYNLLVCFVVPLAVLMLPYATKVSEKVR